MQAIFNPKAQTSEGRLDDNLLALFASLLTRHRLAVGHVANAIGFSTSYVGNATRFPGDPNRLKVSAAFGNAFLAVVEALDRAKTPNEVAAALKPVTKAVAPALVVAPSPRAEESSGRSVDDLVALMRRLGIQSIALQPVQRAEPEIVREAV